MGAKDKLLNAVRHIASGVFALVVATMAPVAFAAPAVADDAVGATTDFFVKMSARDFAGVSRYIPREGFSEVTPESDKLLQLDAQAFDGLFQSGLVIDLRVSDMQAKSIGDAAIVTGTRVGSITPVNGTAIEGRLIFTMVWTKGGEGWMLQHIHFSAPAANK